MEGEKDKIGAFLILIGQRANFIHWIGIYPLDKVYIFVFKSVTFLFMLLVLSLKTGFSSFAGSSRKLHFMRREENGCFGGPYI